VAEWRYDPADPPTDRAIRVEVLEQNLFPDGQLGDAAFVHGAHAYVYGCDAPVSMDDADDPGQCRVSRVKVSVADDAGAYEDWTGEGWRPSADLAPMAMEPADGGQSLPPGPFSVGPAPDGDGFVMVYSPWPGHVSSVEVRAALSPEGPWSAPVRIDLPNCADSFNGQLVACYSANVQPDMSGPGRLAFGYYDRFVSGPPLRGSYVVSSVPFSLDRGR
jgi:hypothetical protein